MLTGRVAIVTGGCGDIGGATARLFLKEGARVALADVRPPGEDPAPARAHRSGSDRRLLYVETDVSDAGSLNRMIGATLKEFGRIDILVNAAGVCTNTPAMQISLEEWEKVIRVNLTGTFLCCQAVAPEMIKQRWGKIVNLASVAGKTGGALVGAHYAASKAAVACLTKSLARELAPYGILVNTVAPGVIETQMIAGYQYDLAKVPLGRKGSPEDVARAILFLASPLSDYMTGATVDVNGGMLMD